MKIINSIAMVIFFIGVSSSASAVDSNILEEDLSNKKEKMVNLLPITVLYGNSPRKYPVEISFSQDMTCSGNHISSMILPKNNWVRMHPKEVMTFSCLKEIALKNETFFELYARGVSDEGNPLKDTLNRISLSKQQKDLDSYFKMMELDNSIYLGVEFKDWGQGKDFHTLLTITAPYSSWIEVDTSKKDSPVILASF